jgi:hypothetical protein
MLWTAACVQNLLVIIPDGFNNATGLPPLPATLTTLIILGAEGVAFGEEPGSLSQLSNLTFLGLGRLQGIRPAGFSSMTSLRTLRVMMPETDYLLELLPALSGLRALTQLRLEFAAPAAEAAAAAAPALAAGGMMPLRKLKRLQHLELDGPMPAGLDDFLFPAGQQLEWLTHSAWKPGSKMMSLDQGDCSTHLRLYQQLLCSTWPAAAQIWRSCTLPVQSAATQRSSCLRCNASI